MLVSHSNDQCRHMQSVPRSGKSRVLSFILRLFRRRIFSRLVEKATINWIAANIYFRHEKIYNYTVVRDIYTYAQTLWVRKWHTIFACELVISNNSSSIKHFFLKKPSNDCQDPCGWHWACSITVASTGYVPSSHLMAVVESEACAGSHCSAARVPVSEQVV